MVKTSLGKSSSVRSESERLESKARRVASGFQVAKPLVYGPKEIWRWLAEVSVRDPQLELVVLVEALERDDAGESLVALGDGAGRWSDHDG